MSDGADASEPLGVLHEAPRNTEITMAIEIEIRGFLNLLKVFFN